ncbi:hypothetical protein HY251_10750 [bacterium]|nr:hypothetical protein [bacterium]
MLVSLMTGSTVRPQGWSFLLLALALLLAEKIRERETARGALGLGAALGAVLALAIQLHGAFVFSFVAVFLVLVGGVWELLCKDARARPVHVWALVLALALGLLGALVHPHGSEALLHPLRYASPELREINEMVQELKPPDFLAPEGQFVEVAVLLLLALALVGRTAWRAADVLLLLAFAHLAWTRSRGLHYFAIAAAAPIAEGISGALSPPRGPVPLRALLLLLERLEPAARVFARFAPAALGAAFLANALASVPALSPGRAGDVRSPRLASHADVADVASFIAAWNPPGEIWNEPEQGGTLIWKLWPARKVFIDGRGDLHARAGTFHDYVVVWDVRESWDAVLRRQGCDVCVVTKEREGSPSSRLLPVLLECDWPVVYQNRTVALLVRPDSRAERSLSRRAPGRR